MASEWRYRGRVVTAEDVRSIRQLIAENPGASRRKLSEKLCEAWQWKQANGALRAMVCRGLLLLLHRAGEIQLPPIRFQTLNPFVLRATPAPMLIDTTPIAVALKQLQPIELQPVRRTGDEPLFNSLMEQHHYLKYEQPVGEHLKYLAWAQGRPIACLAWSSAPRHLGSRDRYIGWSADARRRNIRFIAYNTRFLILPWVRVPHLASHILGKVTRALSDDWAQMYGHPVYFAHYPTTGHRCMDIRSTSRKPSLIPDVFAEPVTARRTGNCSDSLPGAAKTTRPTRRTARSRKSWVYP